MMAMILLVTAISIVLYYYISLPFKYWKNKNVTQPPVSLLFGNIGQALLLQKSVPEIYDELYKKYPELPYIGFYRSRTPCLLARDPSIIKEVMVKNFNSFGDNEIYLEEKYDPLIAKNPFAAKGDHWRESRNRIAPLFTAKRIKEMYPLMDTGAKNLVTYVDTHVVGSKQGVELKELFLKYTADVVTSCALGIDAKAFIDPKCEQIKMFHLVLSTSFFTKISLFLAFNFPILTKILKVKIIPKEAHLYYKTLVNRTLKYRETNKVHRGDFLDSLIQLKEKGGPNKINEHVIAADVVTFIIEGMETSSQVLSFTMYELALHPDIQTNLRQEIDEMLQRCKGEVDFDSIHEMKYLDLIIKESMRKNTISPLYRRVCTKQCTIESPDGTGKSITIEPGTPVTIPIQSIHHDPKYYPNPDIFEPSRFSDENQENRPNYTYIPFGEGPRICFGMRFGLTQVKVALVHLIANFEVTMNKKTVVPYRADPQYFILEARDGIWLDFHKRC